MFINEEKILFARNGTCLLASVSGSTKPLAVDDIDLAIIDSVWRLSQETSKHDNKPPAQLIKEAELVSATQKHPILASAYNGIDPKIIKHKLNAIIDAKGIIDTPNSHPLEIYPADINDEKHCAETVKAEDMLRLSTQFAAVLCEQGFCIWSAKYSLFFALSAKAVSFLFSFALEKTVAKAKAETRSLGLDEKERSLLLSFAKSAGLLCSPKDKIKNTELVLAPFDTKTTTSLGFAKNYKDLKKENKIPVYFVPHMENHFPLALGVLYSALVHYEGGKLLESFQFVPLNYLVPQQLFNGPYRKFGPGVWLFSNYMWSIDINMEISRLIKQHNKANISIHGGPSTPDYQQACEDFLREHQSVDIAVHGEGEVTITEIFDCFNIAKNPIFTNEIVQCDQKRLSTVGGLTYREELSNRLIRTGSRERMKAPDQVPSPYLSGLFDGYQGRVEAAIIETNRGCPYGCTFCDWGSATNQKIRKFDLDRVKDEITWIGKNKVRVMWIADANYGLYDRDIEISQFIVDTKQKYGYPQEIVVNYTKNSTWRLVEIIKIFTKGGIIGQGIISIQTTDEKTLEVINRKNIRTQRYDELAQAFTDLNLPLSTDLMIGLPGMTVDSFKADLQRYIDMDVSVKAYPTQLLPNSPMAEPSYMEKYKIKTDEHSFLISTYSYTPQDLKLMRGIYEVYVMADGYSLLRYVLRYLQWDHDIKAMDFMHKLLIDCEQAPDDYPLITWAIRFFNSDKSMPSGWALFYQQVKRYIMQHYGLSQATCLETAILLNQYSMPDDAFNYPIKVDLQHDFESYFKQNPTNRQKLLSFASAAISLSDPNKLSSVDLDAAQYDTHQYFWELNSPIARPKSQAEFAA